VFDSVFTALFRHPLLAFQQGEFSFALSRSLVIPLLVAAVLAAAAVFTYRSARGTLGRGDRVVLGGVRLAVVAVLVFCLLRPVLVLSSVVPQQNFVAVLVDDSRSMLLDDGTGGTRGGTVQELLRPGSPFRTAMEERYALRFFRFHSGTERLDDPGELTFSGTRTRLGQALNRVREELAGVPLAGVVVLTDGGDDAALELAEALPPLQAGGIPVYPVGVGPETLTRDIQVSRVEVPRRILRGSALEVEVVLTHTGFQGRSVEVVVEDGGRIMATRSVQLPGEGQPATVRIPFTAEEPGPRLLRVRVPVQEGEVVERNNLREALMVVEDRRDRILYYEGEPRHEVAFMRRAMAEDRNLQVVLLQRTHEDRFLRLDVEDASELAAGFPRTREDLFRYQGLILGSVEASSFTPDQLRMIADFVGERGGGLLALGGQRALGQGGYQGTAVAEVLPVVVDGSSARDGFWGQFTVAPTRAGATHPVTRLAEDEESSLQRWGELPPLSTHNPVTRLKPGATALLTGRGEAFPEDQVVLAFQRFGRGKALAFPVHDLWMWRMHADIPLEDRTHQTLWRQLLRWLVEGVPRPVELAFPPEDPEPGEAMELRARVVDRGYGEVNNAAVTALVTAPDGSTTPVPLQWTLARDGEYAAPFTPPEPGLYEVVVEASRGEEVLGEQEGWLRAAVSDREYFDAAMRAPLLRRLARETGGRFHTPASIQELPEEIRITGGGITQVEELSLWDMPILLFLLLALVAGEWGYRRARGLA